MIDLYKIVVIKVMIYFFLINNKIRYLRCLIMGNVMFVLLQYFLYNIVEYNDYYII